MANTVKPGFTWKDLGLSPVPQRSNHPELTPVAAAELDYGLAVAHLRSLLASGALPPPPPGYRHQCTILGVVLRNAHTCGA